MSPSKIKSLSAAQRTPNPERMGAVRHRTFEESLRGGSKGGSPHGRNGYNDQIRALDGGGTLPLSYIDEEISKLAPTSYKQPALSKKPLRNEYGGQRALREKLRLQEEALDAETRMQAEIQRRRASVDPQA